MLMKKSWEGKKSQGKKSQGRKGKLKKIIRDSKAAFYPCGRFIEKKYPNEVRDQHGPKASEPEEAYTKAQGYKN